MHVARYVALDFCVDLQGFNCFFFSLKRTNLIPKRRQTLNMKEGWLFRKETHFTHFCQVFILFSGHLVWIRDNWLRPAHRKRMSAGRNTKNWKESRRICTTETTAQETQNRQFLQSPLYEFSGCLWPPNPHTRGKTEVKYRWQLRRLTSLLNGSS